MQTLEPPKLENITLYYREGNSDKVYQCQIEAAGERFVVNFAYGRRGSTLNTGTKTNVPVDYPDAKRIFDKLVKEKTAKGYSPGQNGAVYQSSEQESTGILPQLLNAIEESDVQRYIEDSAYCAQEKFDGKRILIQRSGGRILGINRKGLVCGLPVPIVQTADRMIGDFVLDGECVGETFHAFDILKFNRSNLKLLEYRERYLTLMNLIAGSPSHHQNQIDLVPIATQTQSKARLLKELKAKNKEGIVFKRLDAPYSPGRPYSGGAQFKHKFYATVSAVVAKINQQRSVEIRLLNAEGWVVAGNVTIPANHNVPTVGAVVEIRYLYAFRESGALFQPTYLGPRSDIAQMECLASQLKYKNGEENE